MEREFLLLLIINSSNSLNLPSLNKDLYWFSFVLYIFSSSLSLLKTTFCSALFISESSSTLSDFPMGVIVSPIGVVVGVGVGVNKSFLLMVFFFCSFNTLSLFLSSSINKSSSSYSSIISVTWSDSVLIDNNCLDDLTSFLLDFSE